MFNDNFFDFKSPIENGWAFEIIYLALIFLSFTQLGLTFLMKIESMEMNSLYSSIT